jgi:hypothetical protein
MPKTKRYAWPASALNADAMALLHQASKASRKPITVLIREATDRLVAEIRDKMDDPKSLRGTA